MLALFLLIIFGFGMSYFATQNTGTVHILIGNSLVSDIPLYVVVIISVLLGVLVSWLISLADSFSSARSIHGKESEIRKMQNEINSLKQENHDLQSENMHLKEENGEKVMEKIPNEIESVNEANDEKKPIPSPFHKIKRNFSWS